MYINKSLAIATVKTKEYRIDGIGKTKMTTSVNR